jgi:hypothetical protein
MEKGNGQLTEGQKLRASTKSWLDYLDIQLILLFKFFKPWKTGVIRMIGTERSNCDQMVDYVTRPYIKAISWSQVEVLRNQEVELKGHRPKTLPSQFVGVLIYKHK